MTDPFRRLVDRYPAIRNSPAVRVTAQAMCVSPSMVQNAQRADARKRAEEAAREEAERVAALWLKERL